MTIKDMKELKKFLQLCRKHGVDAVKVDGMEFHLGALPKRQTKSKTNDLGHDPLAYASVPKPNIKETLPTPDNQLQQAVEKIATDGLSEEQLLFYSSDSGMQQ